MSDFDASLADVQERLTRLPYSAEYPVDGCTDEDIKMLEAYAGQSFPKAYSQFLRVFGRQNGRLFKGMHASVSDKHGLHLKELANSMLNRTGSSYRIPDSSFVFTELQGGVFWFFPLGLSDDPPVFAIGEGESEPELLRPSFTEFLEMRIQELEAMAIRRPAALKPWWLSDS